jgi:hypothetical protein
VGDYTRIICVISAFAGVLLALSFMYRPSILRGARFIIPYLMVSALGIDIYLNPNQSKWDVLLGLSLLWGICGLFHLLGWLADRGILNRDKF